MIGTVITGANNVFSVEAQDGELYRCSIKGKKLKATKGFYNCLASGDIVEWEKSSSGQGAISDLIERKNMFWRYNEKGKAIQVIAANLDQVICVTSCAFPPFRPRFIDRCSLEPASSKIPFIIALNKTDLGIDESIKERMNDYKKIGFKVIELSTLTGEGFDELHALIKDKISVFVGQSGVGKSSILNKLENGLGMRVGEVCEKYERGRHTTVAALMVKLQDGKTRVIDTPGVRRFAVRGIDPASLYACFPDISAVAKNCQLGSRCLHESEPGCAIPKAVEEGLVHCDRYESYLRILSELTETKTYAKKQGRPYQGRASQTRAFQARADRDYFDEDE